MFGLKYVSSITTIICISYENSNTHKYGYVLEWSNKNVEKIKIKNVLLGISVNKCILFNS